MSSKSITAPLGSFFSPNVMITKHFRFSMSGPPSKATSPARGHEPEDGDERLGVGETTGQRIAIELVHRDLDDVDVLALRSLAAAGSDATGIGHLGVVKDR